MSILEHDIDTEHVHEDERPFVSNGHMAHRILLARESDGLVVMHWRSAPGVVSGTHRHNGAVLVYTLAGTWSHRPDVMDYRAGSYVAEPLGATHQFFAGPDPVEAIGYSWGVTDAIGPDGEVVGHDDIHTKVARYYQMCEAQGFGRPKILS